MNIPDKNTALFLSPNETAKLSYGFATQFSSFIISYCTVLCLDTCVLCLFWLCIRLIETFPRRRESWCFSVLSVIISFFLMLYRIEYE